VETIAENLDWSLLTPQMLAIAETIAFPISCGTSLQELAAKLGVNQKTIQRRLDALRKAIEELIL
jgi:DNA-binding MarR family transcriptional regulator